MAQISIKKTLAKILNTPMIVEQGTSGIWTYRKWSDGTAECWGLTSYTSHAMTQQSGNGYYSQETYNLPSGLFTSINNATGSKTGSGGLVTISFYTATTGYLGYYCICTSSLTVTFGIFFNVKGRWK